jgi:hypothetical protein
MTGGIAEDFQTVKTMFGSKEWAELYKRLEEYVTNFQKKVIHVTPYFPLI